MFSFALCSRCHNSEQFSCSSHTVTMATISGGDGGFGGDDGDDRRGQKRPWSHTDWDRDVDWDEVEDEDLEPADLLRWCWKCKKGMYLRKDGCLNPRCACLIRNVNTCCFMLDTYLQQKAFAEVSSGM